MKSTSVSGPAAAAVSRMIRSNADHPLEPLPHAIGVHVALDHQERAPRVAGEHRPCRADGRREVEVGVLVEHDGAARGRRHLRDIGEQRRGRAAAAMADRSCPASVTACINAVRPAPMRTSTPSPCRGENAWRMMSAVLSRSFDLGVQRRRRGARDRVIGDDAGREAVGFRVLEDRPERRAVGSASGCRRGPARALRCWSSCPVTIAVMPAAESVTQASAADVSTSAMCGMRCTNSPRGEPVPSRLAA